MAAKKGDRAAAGCLALFALPFAAVGVLALYLAASTVWTWTRMQSWVEVPARLESLELEEHDGDDSTTYEVHATYRYSIGGRDFTGDRVAIGTMADNIGSFHQDLYKSLRRAENAGTPVTAYVDPADSSSATLNRELRLGLLSLELVFGLVFGGVGFGLMIGGRYGFKKTSQERERAARHPDAPWLWREEWADGNIRSSARASAYAAAGFALLWNLIALPAGFFVPGEVAKGNYPALIALVFPLVGIGLAVWAGRAWLQARRFKSATLALTRMPVALGGRLRGSIRVDSHVPATREFRIELSCVERVKHRTSKGSETSERIVWQNQWTVAREHCQLLDNYTSIPLDLAIPRDAPAAGTIEDDDRVEWRLDASAECPGPDFWMRVNVPVFDVGDGFGAATLDEALASGGIPGEDSHDDSRNDSRDDSGHDSGADAAADGATERPDAGRLAALGIVYERLPQGGESWTFKRAQHKSVAAMLTAVAAIFGVSAVVLFFADAPVILAIAFAAFDAIFIWWTLHLWFAEYRVTLDDRLLTVARRGVAGAGKVVEIPRQWVKTVRAQRGMQAGNKLYYDLKVETADDTLTAASSVPDYTVASWLASHWMNGGRQRA
jgi:hypothetical protein